MERDLCLTLIQDSTGELWNWRNRMYETIEALCSKEEQKNEANGPEPERKMGAEKLFLR